MVRLGWNFILSLKLGWCLFNPFDPTWPIIILVCFFFGILIPKLNLGGVEILFWVSSWVNGLFNPFDPLSYHYISFFFFLFGISIFTRYRICRLWKKNLSTPSMSVKLGWLLCMWWVGLDLRIFSRVDFSFCFFTICINQKSKT